MPKSTFVYSIYIAGSVEAVWKALLDGQFTRQYWGHDNVSDWQPGSPWEHRRADGTGTVAILGEVVEAQPPHRLIITWADPADRTRNLTSNHPVVSREEWLSARDVTMVVASRAPFAKLFEYQKRMEWRFKWVSSGDSDFNFDHQASFTPEEMAAKRAMYNFAIRDPKAREREGHSIFYRDARGAVFHTYSCYDRGNDKLNLHYHYLDLVPKGRNEQGRGPSWVRRHDEYDR